MDTLTVRLRLDSLEELYRTPEFDPFSSSEAALSGRSGMELLLLRILPEWKNQKVAISLQLPAHILRPDLDADIETAIDRMADARIAANTNELSVMRRNGLRALLRGLIFLTICLLLSGLFYGEFLTFLPSFVNAVLGEGFIIIGWIALWHPFEALAYDRIPLQRENKILRRTKDFDITVEPAP